MRGWTYKGLPSLAAALCGLGWARPVSAQERDRVDFAWLAPEGCPSASSVRAEIDDLLGRAFGEGTREQLWVRATVARRARWLVTLDTRSSTATGRRTIEAASCQALGRATALIVALMIDPDAVAAHAKQEAKPHAPPAMPTLTIPVPEPPPPAARATFALAGLGATGNLGVLPGADVSLLVAAGLARGPWRMELRAAFSLRKVRSDPVADAGDAYGSFRFFAGTLAGCWMSLGNAVDLGPCAEVELGAVSAVGVGKIQVTSEITPWFGAGAGGLAVLKASSRLRFPIRADVVVPLWRPSYLFREDSAIFRAWPVGGRLTAGVELQF